MNVIKKFHEQSNLSYKQMAQEINEQIASESNEKTELQERTLICYANGTFLPKQAIIINALAKYFNTTTKDLIQNLKTTKEQVCEQ